MKVFIILSGFIIAMLAVFAGLRLDAQAARQQVLADKVGHDIERMDAEVLAWEGLPREERVRLSDAYKVAFNDLQVLAQAHRLSYTVKVDGANTPDILSAARDSDWAGVKALKLQVVFSGISSRAALLSLLDSMDTLEYERSLFFSRVHMEKDVVMIDLTVMGVEA